MDDVKVSDNALVYTFIGGFYIIVQDDPYEKKIGKQVTVSQNFPEIAIGDRGAIYSNGVGGYYYVPEDPFKYLAYCACYNDWYYMMSDDGRSYQAGLRRHQRLQEAFKKASAIDSARAIALWNKYCTSKEPIDFTKKQ
jgi:hypothetical protein